MNSYEAAVQREMIAQARRCAQLEMALEKIRVKLEVYLPHVEGDGKDELAGLIVHIDNVLGDKP